MKVKILEWCGSPVGITLNRFYAADGRGRFIDGNGELRPLSMAKYEIGKMKQQSNGGYKCEPTIYEMASVYD